MLRKLERKLTMKIRKVLIMKKMKNVMKASRMIKRRRRKIIKRLLE